MMAPGMLRWMNTSAGQPGGLDHLLDLAPDHLGFRGGLEDHGVAGQQRGHDLMHRDAERIVPRRDDADYAEGDAEKSGCACSGTAASRHAPCGV